MCAPLCWATDQWHTTLAKDHVTAADRTPDGDVWLAYEGRYPGGPRRGAPLPGQLGRL